MRHTVFQSKLGRTLTVLGVVLLAMGLKASFFAVDVTDYVVVTRYGRVMRVIAEPGLRVKLPTPIDSVVRLPKRLLSFKPPRAEYLTQDKKNQVEYQMATACPHSKTRCPMPRRCGSTANSCHRPASSMPCSRISTAT